MASKERTAPNAASLVTPSTIGGAILGGVAGGSIFGPMGTIAGLVVGAVAGEVIDHSRPGRPQLSSDREVGTARDGS